MPTWRREDVNLRIHAEQKLGLIFIWFEKHSPFILTLHLISSTNLYIYIYKFAESKLLIKFNFYIQQMQIRASY